MIEQNKTNLTQIIAISLLVSLIGGGLTFLGLNYLSSKTNFLQSITNSKTGKSGIQKTVDNKTVYQIEEESETAKVIEKATNSVVSIVGEKEYQYYYGANNDPFGNNDLFERMFGFPRVMPSQPPSNTPKDQQPKQKVSAGTGFIIDKDGTIITNEHVVSLDAEYKVILNNGKEYKAKILAKDQSTINDFAILKIDTTEPLEFLDLGDSDSVKVGQTVIAIGNTLGEYQNTATKGIISGLGREIQAGDGQGQTENLSGIIQTDAAISPGNSGGPLLNLEGKVVGINTAIDRQGQLVGFAIPINPIKQAIKDVKEFGEIIRPYLGIRYVNITKAIQENNKLAYDYGIIIIRGENLGDLAVLPGSPADKAGLEENDIILEINGKKIDNKDVILAREIQKYKVGDEITFKIFHDGKEKEVKVMLEKAK